jgi:uncharacterized protein (DUF697 family)
MSSGWPFGDQGDEREQRCKRLVEHCGYAAAALTLLPIPGSEIVAVMPLHVGMVIGIAEVYGVALTRQSASDLVLKIGATVGLSLIGSRAAMTAGKIILPGLGGLLAAPFMYASTVAIGAVARAYFRDGGRIAEAEMRAVYEEAAKRAKEAFDPERARSDEAQAMAKKTAAEAEPQHPSPAAGGPTASREATPTEPRRGASIDDLADRLATLAELHERGAISNADYERRKAEILDEV